MRDSFPFNGKATGYARGPIPEADFPRPGEDVTVGDKKGNLASRSDAWGVCFTVMSTFLFTKMSHPKLFLLFSQRFRRNRLSNEQFTRCRAANFGWYAHNIQRMPENLC